MKKNNLSTEEMAVLLVLTYSYYPPKGNFIATRQIEHKKYNLQIMHEAHNEQMKALPSVWPMTKGGFFTKFHDVIKKKSGSLGSFIKKRNDVSKKELFFIHFHTRPTIDEIPEKE